MTGYDIESAVEDMVVKYLQQELGVTKVSFWHDRKKAILSPEILVAAGSAVHEPGTWSTFAAMRVPVDVSAFTSRRMDESARTARSMRADVRRAFGESDVIASLNQAAVGITVYPNGLILEDGTEADTELENQRGVTVQIVVHINAGE